MIHTIILIIGYFSEDSESVILTGHIATTAMVKATVPFHRVCIQEDVVGQYLNSQDDKRSRKVHDDERTRKVLIQ